MSDSDSSSDNKDLKSLLTKGLISAATLAGATAIPIIIEHVLEDPSTPTNNSAEIVPPPQEFPSPNQTPPNPPSIPQEKASPILLGWIRIGAVDNTAGIASTGEVLIATTQPVTIAPIKVPAIGDQVLVLTGVNLRTDYPKSPSYALHKKISVLTPNQKIIILDIQAFVDSDSPNYTIVWAKVGAP